MKRCDKIVQQQVTVAKSMRVNTTVACDWLNFEVQSLRLILVATDSRRANTRFSKESPRVSYCYARGNQQREFFVNLLVYSRGNHVQQQVTVAKSMRVNTTVACDWLNFEVQSLRLILVATDSRRANTRFSKESPRVSYCYARGNQQREFFVNLLVYSRGNQQLGFLTHLLVYAPAGLSM
ncbi:hypothetical protein F511_21185 [Dorcoceras hygrometricum]|uniref:Uncharacterized protein n=1 Tax=Dorcoceras hygrometricum TaxID=472368 RepID=A0A2Z7ACD9_9LAMI|nr:hypothetical protein F511_21185 [Dorcoceras hygrometricum]